MAKKKKKDAAVAESQEKNSVFQWVLFVIVIPLLFAITIALIVMTIAGVNVFEKAKDIGQNIPGISSMLDDEKADESGKPAQEKMTSLQAELKNKEAKLEKLQKKLDDSDKEIESLKTERDRLEVQLEQLQNQAEKPEAEEKKANALTATYKEMSPKNIANILVNLKDNEAIAILSELDTKKRADIMEKLPPATAANYTKKLSETAQ